LHSWAGRTGAGMRQTSPTEGRVSRISRNFIIAYVVLVGLPVLGLIQVLKSGRGLAAPLSVDGTWKLQTDASPLSKSPCGNPATSFQNPLLQISQSGKALVLTLSNGAKMTTPGAIEGTKIRAAFPPSATGSNQTGCGNEGALVLTATVDPKSDPRSLVGMLSVDNCSACATVEFRGERQTAQDVKGAH
jgi:hypothetical protein